MTATDLKRRAAEGLDDDELYEIVALQIEARLSKGEARLVVAVARLRERLHELDDASPTLRAASKIEKDLGL